jgi:carbon storage regulator
MLVLSRKAGQSIIINENIELTILDVQGDQIKIGVKAPKSVKVYRKEIFLEIQEENKIASNPNVAGISNVLTKLSETQGKDS